MTSKVCPLQWPLLHVKRPALQHTTANILTMDPLHCIDHAIHASRCSTGPLGALAQVAAPAGPRTTCNYQPCTCRNLQCRHDRTPIQLLHGLWKEAVSGTYWSEGLTGACMVSFALSAPQGQQGQLRNLRRCSLRIHLQWRRQHGPYRCQHRDARSRGEAQARVPNEAREASHSRRCGIP